MKILTQNKHIHVHVQLYVDTGSFKVTQCSIVFQISLEHTDSLINTYTAGLLYMYASLRICAEALIMMTIIVPLYYSISETLHVIIYIVDLKIKFVSSSRVSCVLVAVPATS